ncbi:MAG: glutamine amidotransferase [Cyanobacteria bacterium P01_F01_bin.143]
MKNAVAIRHVAFEDLGTLAPILERRGYQIDYIDATSSRLLEIDPLYLDLLVILGGPIGAYDEGDYPFLLNEFRLLESRLAADLPTLGICLGSQLMARVLGAKVYPGSGKEIGWSPIQLSDAGKQSPLRYLVTKDNAVLHWHGDTFDLPQGATHLASSNQYVNQAFAWGKCALGLQFHPEVTTRGLENWFVGHASEINTTTNISVKQLRADTHNYSSNLQAQAINFWQAWLAQVEQLTPKKNLSCT